MDTIYLRPLAADDLERTWRWHNDPALYDTLGGTFRHVSRETEAEWLKQKMAPSSHEVNLAICLSDSGEHIGNAYLRDIDWVHRRAELHLFIGDDTMRGKGYGQFATRELVRHAFHDLNLRRLYLHVLADNARAIRTYEKCGFTAEGRLQQHAFKHDKFVDVLVMGLLRGSEK